MALGLRPRRAPGVDVQRIHELALAALVARIETASPGLVVFTERERARQADGEGRFSVMVPGGGSGRSMSADAEARATAPAHAAMRD